LRSGKLWTSPELLRAEAAALAEGDYSTEHFCSAKGDVYAFGIIVHEIVTRKGVFYLGEDDEMEARGEQ
jgi:atrial natriuretic peptide receptor A